MKLHKFSSTSEAYDCTQCGCTFDADKEIEVKNGDLLVIEAEQVVGVADTWPFAVTVATGQLHIPVVDGTLSDGVASRLGPHLLRAMGQALLRGWSVREQMLKLLPPVMGLTCACCGNYHKGRQWFNRDDGYGLCNNCIDDCVTDPLDWLEPGCSYGVPGIHYDIDGAHYRAKAGA